MTTPRIVSFGRRLTELAAAKPNATVITLAKQDGSEDTLTYAELEAWSNRAARLFASMGLGPSSMLCIGIYNSLEHYAAAYGAWKLGACTLPLSPRMPDIEFQGITSLVEKKLVIADRDDAQLRKSDITALRHATTDASALPDITAHPGKAIGSGGSTGRSKIIVDPNPWARAIGDMLLGANVGMRPGQVQLVAGPLYHNSPFSWSHYGIFDAHHIVVMERFDAALATELIERHGVQFGFMAPTMMMRIVRLPDIDRRDFSSLESIFVTAAACPPWLKHRWIELTAPEKVIEGFGSSEAAGACLIRGDEWLLHPGSVGRPAGGAELRILDDAFNEVPQGDVGEIFFRPPCHPAPTYTYIGSPPAKTTPDGFISVGDLGYLDADGYLFLSDRRVDLIIRGGANIYPAEVEAALTEHPDITDAAVVGIPHDELGKTVHAIVEPRPGATIDEPALRAWMKQRLTTYKVPESYEFMPQLPRDQSGKIRRSQLARERENLKVA